MASDKAVAAAAVARLAPMGPVAWRRMFGGFGVHLEGVMFALIADDVLYLKVDDRNRPEFEAAGSRPFTFERKNKPVQTSYWRIPDGVFDDGEALCRWAAGAHAAALRVKAGKPRQKKSRQA